ncbi:hypothetical protein HHK36_016015 [Tetracentron sinense]|uniref:tRNA-binding domain-containing protein n=1 Tax=Tetracentron sinense TaxID=13715 RepID=A0A835DB44_TETSI|nr:hypothetical protein HHK36_016015 [Tetracentron sinense]
MAFSGASNESILHSRKQALVSSLCKRHSLDPVNPEPPKKFSSFVENDFSSLFSNILKLSGSEVPLKNNDEVMKWVAFADSFPVDSAACHCVLKGLNEDLIQRSVLLGDGLKPSEVDVVVFSALHSFVSCLSNSDRHKFPNVMRWMDYIQNKEDLGEVFEKIPLEKAGFEPQVAKSVAKVEVDSNTKKSVQIAKNLEKLGADSNPKKSISENFKQKVAVAGDNKVTKEKKLPEKEAVEKDREASISLLNIQVGLIRKAWKHPSADSLLVEEIDLGDVKLRQVVSGLAKYCSPDELTNRWVILITNVKPGKLRDEMSEGLVLCASNKDHTIVEPLLPPEGAKLGERVSFAGHEGKPEDVLNPKKKQLEKITPHLYTDDNGVATFKGIPFMTSGGPCTSSVTNASIK